MNRRTSKKLIERLQLGDAEAFSEVYNQYIAKIYRYVLFKVRTREEAEDISAEVFLRAWQNVRNRQRPVQSLNAFLYQIAKNLVIDHYRQRAQITDVAVEEIADQVQGVQQQRLFQKIEQSMEIGRVERAVRGLKDEYKDVVLLRHVEGLSINEIAQVTGKTRGAVRVTLHRALKIIRDQLTSGTPDVSQHDHETQ